MNSQKRKRFETINNSKTKRMERLNILKRSVPSSFFNMDTALGKFMNLISIMNGIRVNAISYIDKYFSLDGREYDNRKVTDEGTNLNNNISNMENADKPAQRNWEEI